MFWTIKRGNNQNIQSVAIFRQKQKEMTYINKLTKVHKNTVGRPNEKLLTKQVIQQTPLKTEITFIFNLFSMTKNYKTKRKAT